MFAHGSKRTGLSRASLVIAATLASCDAPPDELSVSAPELPVFPDEILCPEDAAPSGVLALPKNIILIIGDGMGPLQVEAGRLQNGGPLAWDSLSGPVYLNTDSLTTDRSEDMDSAPTDSAASATAMATGARVLNGAVGVDENGMPLETVLETAKAAGKAVGVVTTSYLYDASPMAFAAHVPERGMFDDIVTQLLTDSLPDVVMGGALDLFARNDNAYALMAEGAGYHLVHDATELAAWQPESQPMLLGLFQSSYPSLEPAIYQWGTTPVATRDQTSTDPTLPEMVSRALDRLSRDDDGFFLFVENENIDTLGHVSIFERDLARQGMPQEVATLSAAVQNALDWVADNSSFEETLVVITADHECGDYTLLEPDILAAFFLSINHTRKPVALWAAGPGTENIDSLCRISDVYSLLTGRLPAGQQSIALY